MDLNKCSINDNLIIDVAIICQEITHIDKMCNDHITNLDAILITKELFQSIFYPYCTNFGIDKSYACNNDKIFPYISFLPQYRSVHDRKFYLLEQIIKNIETDLNISRDCFTIESRVELTNQLASINSLCDINCCSVLSSLTWNNILEIINNYKILDTKPGCETKEKDELKLIHPIFVVSIIFKTPTCDVNNTVIRFNYKIINI